MNITLYLATFKNMDKPINWLERIPYIEWCLRLFAAELVIHETSDGMPRW